MTNQQRIDAILAPYRAAAAAKAPQIRRSSDPLTMDAMDAIFARIKENDELRRVERRAYS